MKKYSAIPALLVLLAMASNWMTPAQAGHSTHSRYEHMLNLRFKEKWLAPPVVLPEGESAWILDFHRKLRAFSNGQIARDIEKVDMTFQPGPFGPDSLRSRDQARALTELGLLASMGHFAVLNANDPNVRVGAVSIINQLADIADHFKIGNLPSQYQRLAADVADPKFIGGPSPIVTRYDATLNALYDWVAYSYGVDGHWYFMNGNCWAGLYVLSSHQDQEHTQYYLTVLNDLFHNKPRYFPDIYTRSSLRITSWEPERDSELLQRLSWATMNHYITGSNYYVDPRYPHFDENWNRYRTYP